MTKRESDPLIVLRGQESWPHGKGADNYTQGAKETSAGIDRPDKLMPTSLQLITNMR